MRSLASLAASPDEEEVEAHWNRLALLTPQPDPFCATTHWQLAFREAIDPRRTLFVRRADEGLIQFAQHELSNGKALGPIERNWLFGANLLGSGAMALFADLLADIERDEGAICPIVLSGLAPDGAVLAALNSKFGAKFALTRFRTEVQCAASLEHGLDGFLSRRSANHRRNLRRQAKRAAENGVLFEPHNPKSADEADAVFARMLAVELTSWKGLDGCGMQTPSMTRFYSIMLRRLARSGSARVILATQDGRDVGFIFGGVAAGIYRGQQFSFDEQSAALSIGNLLQFEQIQWLCSEGATRYDLGPLLGPSMDYKYHWTEIALPIEAWILRSR